MIRNVIKNMIMKECFENLEVTSVPYDIVFAGIVQINAGSKKRFSTSKKRIKHWFNEQYQGINQNIKIW